MGARISTLALVARAVDYGEADRVLTLLSPTLGKISALARSARASRRRFGGALGLFVVGEATLRQTRGELLALERFEAREDLSGSIAADVIKVAHGSYILELARELWPAGQRDPPLFELVVEALRALACHAAAPALLRAFELKLLHCAGVGPAVDHCAACGLGLLPMASATAPLGLSVLDGGVLCDRCATGRSTLPLSAAAHARLGALLRGPLDEAASATGDPAVARELRDLMLALTHHHLGKELRTLAFISQLSARRGAS